MKKGLVTILFIILTFSLYAKCTSQGIWITGENRLVFKNSIIVIEFYEGSLPIAKGLNKEYPVYLQSGDEKIPLIIKEVLPGGYRITQVVVTAAQQPAIGKKYTLVIRNLKKNDARPEYYNYDTKKNEPYTFSGIAPPAAGQLLFSTAPVEIKKTMASYGCGPARWIYYRQSNSVPGAYFIKASLTDRTTGITTNFIFVPEKDGTIKVGHGMCSGAFGFTEQHMYEITFSLLDLAGNKSETTSPLPLAPPFKETGGE